MQRLPPESFEFYVSLGTERSYRAVAEKYGVSKRAVVDHARTECWIERLQRIEAEARERSEQRLVETIEEQRTRHLKTLRALHGRAIEALRTHTLDSCMEAAKVIEMVVKLERLITGEPSQRAQIAIEEVTRREIESLVGVDGEDEVKDEGDAGEAAPH